MKDTDNHISNLRLKKLVPANDIKSAVHDLNNLMNYIINGIEIINDNEKSDLTTKNILNNIKKNSKLASNILLQLSSSWSRPVNFKSSIKINETLKDLIDSLGYDTYKNVKINFNPLEHDEKILVNKTDFERAILNLIINANEADSSKITITVKVGKHGKDKFILIEVSDNGNGIDKNQMNNLFNEGFSTKQKNNNSGYGLSIVKKIVENHSGSIDVKSEVGKGTCFRLKLPFDPGKYKLNKLNGRTILLVEDDQFQREVLKDLLQSLNITVVTANDGLEALKKLSDVKIDLIIIDKIMPNMDGEECIHEIKKMGYSFPIVLTSGSEIYEEDNEYVSKVLKKPYNFEMIQSILVELLV